MHCSHGLLAERQTRKLAFPKTFLGFALRFSGSLLFASPPRSVVSRSPSLCETASRESKARRCEQTQRGDDREENEEDEAMARLLARLLRLCK